MIIKLNESFFSQWLSTILFSNLHIQYILPHHHFVQKRGSNIFISQSSGNKLKEAKKWYWLMERCTCPFFNQHLDGSPIKYLSLIKYLINQSNKPNPFKYPMQHPTSYLGLFLKYLGIILKPKRNLHEAHSSK